MERRIAGEKLRHGNKIILLPARQARKPDYTPHIIVAVATILSALIVSSSRRD